MIKVTALTSGKLDPSSRLRVRQHIILLKELGIKVHEYIPFIDKYAPLPALLPEKQKDKYYSLWRWLKLSARIPGILGSRKSDVTWLLRDLFPGSLTFEPFLKRPLVFDVDDAIWLNLPFGQDTVISIAKRADVIIAGNSCIANYLEPYAPSLFIVPTAVDTEKFRPEPFAPHDGKSGFTIGWIGTASNLNYLLTIEGPLAKFMTDHPDVEFLVVSNNVPAFNILPSYRVHFIPWSEDNEVTALKRIDVGIMPLPDNEWTRGKCSYKMLLYMACGIPVVISPVGMNVEVLGRGTSGLAAYKDMDWYDAFRFFYKNRNSARTYGIVGRNVVETYYSRKMISGMLAGILKGFR